MCKIGSPLLSFLLCSLCTPLQEFNDEKIENSKKLFEKFLVVCEDVEREGFLTKNGSFNVSLFDCVFVAVAEKISKDGENAARISQESFDALRADERFNEAITHSTSHKASVQTRLELSRKFLYNEIV